MIATLINSDVKFESYSHSISTSKLLCAMIKASRFFAILFVFSSFVGNHVIKCQDEKQQQQQQPASVGQLWLMPSVSTEEGTQAPSWKLAELLKRVGPNMRASADYHDYTDIKLNESLEAWDLLHEQARQFAQNQVAIYQPQLLKLFNESNVSSTCLSALNLSLNSLASLKSWAVQAWSSSGSFPPTGLFDGHFTDLGSYRGCVDIKIPKQHGDSNTTISAKHQADFRHTSYCVVAFRPIVSSRRLFHMIFQKESSKLINRFPRDDALNDVAQFAQYFHYVYLKTGVCLPSSCSPLDVQAVAQTIGQRLALMPGPVKCFTRELNPTRGFSPIARNSLSNDETHIDSKVFGEIETKPFLIELNKSITNKQFISLLVVGGFFGLVFLATLWHFFTICMDNVTNRDNQKWFCHDDSAFNGRNIDVMLPSKPDHLTPSRLNYVAIEYFSMITNAQEFFLQTATKSTEIKCLHGLRVLTMIWIIVVHTLQFNEWSGFARIFENVSSLQDPVLHPLLNANYVVDNFFLMSGLLVAYTTWFSHKGTSSDFSMITSLIGRYLRLTPQVLLISLLYIILPLAGDGPFWFDMTHYEAKFCERNWWVNLLHLQAFYRSDDMCNLVGWWISVDMFYYVVALVVVWMILNKHIGRAITTTTIFVGTCIAISIYRHYTGNYTPGNLGVVPQVGEVWTKFVVDYVWTPYPHAYVFFLGLWIGYILANNKWRQQVMRWSTIGWISSLVGLIGVNYSSHFWMSGALELGDQYISTSYNILCTIIWANAFGWVIVACHYDCGSILNKLLSNKITIIMSKASFIIYLSHMLIVRSLYGSRYNVIELSVATLSLVMIGNIFFATLLGVFLCIAFEGPCMKFQKFIVQSIKRKHQVPIAGSAYDATEGTEKDFHGLDNVESKV